MCANYCKSKIARSATEPVNDSIAGDRYSPRTGTGSSGSHLSALSMVTSVEIKNFRGFKEFTVGDLAPINVIVGDNASGKTAVLEAIYLAVSGSAQQPFILKQWRGQDVRFQTGSVASVAEGIYADLFHDSKSQEPIIIKLAGRGFENRQLMIARSSDVIVPLQNRKERRAAKKTQSKNVSFQTPVTSQISTVPIVLTWTDEQGNDHSVRALLKPSGLEFEGTREPLPNCFLFASLTAVSASDAAGHFSALKKNRNVEKFRKIFLSVFDQIVDIDLGETGGISRRN
jgi:AAA ATPase domain